MCVHLVHDINIIMVLYVQRLFIKVLLFVFFFVFLFSHHDVRLFNTYLYNLVWAQTYPEIVGDLGQAR